jgi:hypothetical protein
MKYRLSCPRQRLRERTAQFQALPKFLVLASQIREHDDAPLPGKIFHLIARHPISKAAGEATTFFWTSNSALNRVGVQACFSIGELKALHYCTLIRYPASRCVVTEYLNLKSVYTCTQFRSVRLRLVGVGRSQRPHLPRVFRSSPFISSSSATDPLTMSSLGPGRLTWHISLCQPWPNLYFHGLLHAAQQGNERGWYGRTSLRSPRSALEPDRLLAQAHRTRSFPMGHGATGRAMKATFNVPHNAPSF